MDKFPEAFKRFEKTNPEIHKSKNFTDLREKITFWGKGNWIDSRKQVKALAVEAKRLNIGERYEIIHFIRNEKPQTRLRDIETGRWTKKTVGENL